MITWKLLVVLIFATIIEFLRRVRGEKMSTRRTAITCMGVICGAAVGLFGGVTFHEWMYPELQDRSADVFIIAVICAPVCGIGAGWYVARV